MKQYTIIIAIIFALIGCKREHLYYQSCNYTTVKIAINWDSIANLSPKGATAIAYNIDGSLYKVFAPSNSSDTITVALPEGNYTVIVVNNAIEEQFNTLFFDFDSIQNLTISPKYVVDNVAKSLDTIAIATIDNIVIDKLTREYYYNRPTTPYAKEQYRGVAERVTTLIDVRATVKGVQYLASSPLCTLTPLPSSLFLYSKTSGINNLSYEFNLTRFQPFSSDDSSTILRGLVNSVGLDTSGQISDYMLNVSCILINQQPYNIQIPITNLVVDNSFYQPTIFIEVDIEIPEIIGGNSGDGLFGTDLELWEEQEAILPL